MYRLPVAQLVLFGTCLVAAPQAMAQLPTFPGSQTVDSSELQPSLDKQNQLVHLTIRNASVLPILAVIEQTHDEPFRWLDREMPLQPGETLSFLLPHENEARLVHIFFGTPVPNDTTKAFGYWRLQREWIPGDATHFNVTYDFFGYWLDSRHYELAEVPGVPLPVTGELVLNSDHTFSIETKHLIPLGAWATRSDSGIIQLEEIDPYTLTRVVFLFGSFGSYRFVIDEESGEVTGNIILPDNRRTFAVFRR